MNKKSVRKFHITALILSAFMLCFFMTPYNQIGEEQINKKIIKIDSSSYQISELKSEFDYFYFDKENMRISAYNYDHKEKLSDKVDISLIESDTVRFAYEVEYVEKKNLIYLAVSAFDENDNLIDVATATAEPIYYEDDTYDAKFLIEGNVVYLSEILQGEADNCFFFTAVFSGLLAAKIIAVIVVAIKVAIVVAAVVVVGATTYQLIKVTADWIREKEREAEKEKTQNPTTPAIYHYARLSGNKLIIASVPVSLATASENMHSCSSYWTSNAGDARILVMTVSGGFIGPEIDRDYRGQPMKGYYWHYHCTGRSYGGAHSWYGTPYGNVY